MTYTTRWGYTVPCELPPLLTANQLLVIAPNLSSSTESITAVLEGVSSAVRDYCGWHIAPNLECDFIGNGEGRLLMLPAMGVTSVESLAINGKPAPVYQWTAAGMIRLNCASFPREWRSVECRYHAGFDSAAVQQAVAQIALNTLTAAPGVREEHAGQVGITYNATGSGISGGVTLLERDRSILAPYKLARAW